MTVIVWGKRSIIERQIAGRLLVVAMHSPGLAVPPNRGALGTEKRTNVIRLCNPVSQ